jgi:hypothetical protein
VRTLAEVEKDLHVLGCSDGNCVVLRPTGMHTNGGCRCARKVADAFKADALVKILRLHQERADTIRADERRAVEGEVLRLVDAQIETYARRPETCAALMELRADIEAGPHRGAHRVKPGG